MESTISQTSTTWYSSFNKKLSIYDSNFYSIQFHVNSPKVSTMWRKTEKNELSVKMPNIEFLFSSCDGVRFPHKIACIAFVRSSSFSWNIHTDQDLIWWGKETPPHEILTQTKNWCGGGTWPHHMICSYWPRVDLAGEGDPTTWNINTYQDLMWWGNVTPPHDKPIKMSIIAQYWIFS